MCRRPHVRLCVCWSDRNIALSVGISQLPRMLDKCGCKFSIELCNKRVLKRTTMLSYPCVYIYICVSVAILLLCLWENLKSREVIRFPVERILIFEIYCNLQFLYEYVCKSRYEIYFRARIRLKEEE